MMDEYERMLRKQLADLHRSYQEQAAPIIRRLAQIESFKPPPPIVIDFDSLPPQVQQSIRSKSEILADELASRSRAQGGQGEET